MMNRKAALVGVVAVCGLACSGALAQNTPSKPDLKPDVKHIGDQVKKGVEKAKDDTKKAVEDAAKGATGQEMGGMDMKVMEAMMKAGTPGPEHAKMAEHEGAWNVTGGMAMSEGAPMMPMTATAKMTMIMGGRIMKEEFRSSDHGMEMEGHGYFTYNNTSKKYESVWMDSGSTGLMFMSGTRSADGTLTALGECADPVTGQMKKCKIVEKSTKDTIQMQMYEIKSDGKEWKMMELNYTRAANNGLEVKTIDIKPVEKK